MIVDSSAVVAILLEEAGHGKLLDALSSQSETGIGAPTLVETGIVLMARRGVPGRAALSRFIEEADLVVIPFGEHHWSVALDAFSRFGKGRHPAALNFGDCMTYAIAEVARRPLLCVGEAFAQTDLELAGLA